MHYTEKIKIELIEKQNKIDILNEQLTNLMSYLSSDKFAGFQNNYVNASEMFNTIRELRTELNK